MKKIVFLIIITNLLSCNSQTKNKMEFTKPNEDKLYERYLPLMEKLLIDNNYKVLNHQDFRNKIIDYFGVDIDTSKFNDVYLKKGLGYIALNHEKFIDTYQLDRGVIDGAGDAFLDILNSQIKEGVNDEEFVIYNKILFNDDTISISKIIQDKGMVENVVVNLNYEKNKFAYDFCVKNIKNIKDYNIDFKLHILWYNNRDRKEVIRTKLIEDISNNKTEFVLDLFDFLVKNKTIENTFLINKTLAYLLEVELKNHNQDDLKFNLAYGVMINSYDRDKDLLNNFENNNFYGYINLKKYTEIFLDLSDRE